MNLRGVIFDLDGTLLDSLGDIGGAMNDALNARGWPTHPLPAYLRMVGDGIEMLARRAAPVGEEIEELVSDYRTRYGARMEQLTRPYAGVVELLQSLGAAAVAMSVLSNKREDFTVELVGRQFPQIPFVAVRGERREVPRKPDPTQALEIARLMRLDPAQVAFVGDTPIDVKTALAGGMLPVGVGWGFRSEEELREAGARHVLRKPSELLGVLGS